MRAWYQGNERRLEIFGDATYSVLTDEERSQGSETGGALSLTRRFGGVELQAGGELRQLEHDQFAPVRERFARKAGAVWGEVAAQRGRIQASGSLRYQGFSTTASGGRPEAPDLDLMTGRLGFGFQPTDGWTLRAGMARLGRLPGQRELYGDQLGRFLINPDLDPEVRQVTDLSVEKEGGRARVAVTVFAERSTDEIGQRVVMVGGEALRQRINQDGFDSVGIEGSGALEISPDLRVEAHGTFLDFQNVSNANFPAERPEAFGEARLIYAPPAGVGGALFLRARGEAFSIGASGERVALPSAVTFDAELSSRLETQLPVQLFLRVENAFDAFVLPQLGLPAAGRTVRGGVRLSL